MNKDIAHGEGDLTKRLDVESKDEINSLVHWFNQFLENHHSILRKVTLNAAEVVKAHKMINETSSKVYNNTHDQSTRTSHIASSTYQMSSTKNKPPFKPIA